MSDIAEKLLAAIEALEQLTQADTNVSWHIVNCGYDQIEFGASCSCAVPAAIQGLCAADREIVDHFMGLRIKYKRLKYFPGILIEAEQAELRSLETLIAAWSVVILPSLARGYGVTP